MGNAAPESTKNCANIVLLPPRPDEFEHRAGGRDLGFGGSAFGTLWSVRLVRQGVGAALDAEWQTHMEQRCAQALSLIDRQMSPWVETSDLRRFNRSNDGERTVLPKPMDDVVAKALQVAEQTNWAFDPFLGQSVELWGFGARQVASGLPAMHDRERLKQARLGCPRPELEGGVLCKRGDYALDLCGVAKGYAVDLLMQILRKEADVSAVLVEIGGELKGWGVKSDGMPWWAQIETPMAHKSPRILAALHGWACATSGREQRNFTHETREYSHTIDPQTAEPSKSDLQSVTVVDRSCWRADALATALLVMGQDKAATFANRHGVACIFVPRANCGAELMFSDGLAQWLSDD